jgi:hypothetical protein
METPLARFLQEHEHYSHRDVHNPVDVKALWELKQQKPYLKREKPKAKVSMGISPITTGDRPPSPDRNISQNNSREKTDKYSGGKKPVLVLNFKRHGKGYSCDIDNTKIFLYPTGDKWECYAERYQNVLFEHPAQSKTPHGAAKSLLYQKEWFLDSASMTWDSVYYVFHDVIINLKPAPPKQWKRRKFQENWNAPMPGKWTWEIDAPTRPVKRIKHPQHEAVKQLHDDGMWIDSDAKRELALESAKSLKIAKTANPRSEAIDPRLPKHFQRGFPSTSKLTQQDVDEYESAVTKGQGIDDLLDTDGN